MTRRNNSGANHYRAKLKEEDVVEIRRLYNEGWTQKNIAKKFRISQTQVSRIVNGFDWKHVQEEK